jgi:hypothetical protein
MIAVLFGLLIVAGLGIGLYVSEDEPPKKAAGVAFIVLAFSVAFYVLEGAAVSI